VTRCRCPDLSGGPGWLPGPPPLAALTRLSHNPVHPATGLRIAGIAGCATEDNDAGSVRPHDHGSRTCWKGIDEGLRKWRRRSKNTTAVRATAAMRGGTQNRHRGDELNRRSHSMYPTVLLVGAKLVPSVGLVDCVTINVL